MDKIRDIAFWVLMIYAYLWLPIKHFNKFSVGVRRTYVIFMSVILLLCIIEWILDRREKKKGKEIHPGDVYR